MKKKKLVIVLAVFFLSQLSGVVETGYVI